MPAFFFVAASSKRAGPGTLPMLRDVNLIETTEKLGRIAGDPIFSGTWHVYEHDHARGGFSIYTRS